MTLNEVARLTVITLMSNILQVRAEIRAIWPIFDLNSYRLLFFRVYSSVLARFPYGLECGMLVSRNSI